jgi:hypothetical protein
MLASTLIRQTARSIIRPTEIARQVHRQALPIFTPRCPSAVRHVDRLRSTRESSAKPRPTARGGIEQLLRGKPDERVAADPDAARDSARAARA